MSVEKRQHSRLELITYAQRSIKKHYMLMRELTFASKENITDSELAAAFIQEEKWLNQCFSSEPPILTSVSGIHANYETRNLRVSDFRQLDPDTFQDEFLLEASRITEFPPAELAEIKERLLSLGSPEVVLCLTGAPRDRQADFFIVSEFIEILVKIDEFNYCSLSLSVT